MKLAIFDDMRLGIVSRDERSIVDVTAALPWPHDPDPVGAGWWVRLCRDLGSLRGSLEAAASGGRAVPMTKVKLRAPVLNPGKVVACAVNYAEHAAEMAAVHERVGGDRPAWLMRFGVFLKAPSSIIGPADAVVLPPAPVSEGREIHHESELAFVVGKGGANIPEASAFDHIAGYTIGLDMTVRGEGDRSRRKSYDTFTPLGPWLTTADEIADPHALRITLSVNGQTRQDVDTATMSMRIPAIVAYASTVMRLYPGDVVLTGSPPGVGQVRAGDVLETSITGLGSMRLNVIPGSDKQV
jgi:2-keto-4-pentenoate hydratase/2-oxohepta-3-ene-1,7-dioic acid hydratase in catechol pathway